ncbi:MAG: hypothetical protein AAB353_12120 [Candidatus Hydrogenedentota bacterium]
MNLSTEKTYRALATGGWSLDIDYWIDVLLRASTIKQSIIGILLATLFAGRASAQFPTYRPGREFRSLNTELYEIAIQKNGRVDVALANGELIFENVFPMVWFEGEDAAEKLQVDGRWGGRFAVDDKLGRGNGVVIAHKSTEWALRVYPSQPFFAVQVAYTNTTKKAVRVRALLPWCVGPETKGALHLGPGDLITPEGEPLHDISLANRPLIFARGQSGRVFVAAFITAGQGLGQIDASDRDASGAMHVFRAATIFDPPVTVEPGAKIKSEVLYLAFAETDIDKAIERLGRKVSDVSGK